MQQKICRVKMAPLNWRSQLEKNNGGLRGKCVFLLSAAFFFLLYTVFAFDKNLKNIFESCFIANIVTSQAQKRLQRNIEDRDTNERNSVLRVL